jgi:prepilin-type N-terminal cleavage/methylation domain-containing protein
VNRRSGNHTAQPPKNCRFLGHDGFTLLEVVVALTLLSVGAALTLSLISGSLGNIRKVQLRTRIVEHAQTVMEMVLLDDTIQQPTTLSGDFEDGTRWRLRIEEYLLPDPPQQQSSTLQTMPVKLMSYTVQMFKKDFGTSDYQLQTLKLVKTIADNQPAGMTQ